MEEIETDEIEEGESKAAADKPAATAGEPKAETDNPAATAGKPAEPFRVETFIRSLTKTQSLEEFEGVLKNNPHGLEGDALKCVLLRVTEWAQVSTDANRAEKLALLLKFCPEKGATLDLYRHEVSGILHVLVSSENAEANIKMLEGMVTSNVNVASAFNKAKENVVIGKFVASLTKTQSLEEFEGVLKSNPYGLKGYALKSALTNATSKWMISSNVDNANKLISFLKFCLKDGLYPNEFTSVLTVLSRSENAKAHIETLKEMVANDAYQKDGLDFAIRLRNRTGSRSR